MRPAVLALKSALFVVVTLSALAAPAASARAQSLDWVPIPGGRFAMGDPEGAAKQTAQRVTVAPFRLQRTEVTNAAFRRFVAETGHVTDPARKGWGYVWTGRWQRVPGADWRHPFGPDSDLNGKAKHPVVQVSQRDAAAYCAWAGGRLPTAREWAFAARGHDGRRYPWGDQPPDQRPPHRANFGTVACCAPSAADGFARTAPVGRFPAGRSPFGLDDMAGNVWEWTASAFPGRPDQVVLRGGGWGNNPRCLRTTYRHGNPPDIGLDMVGIRCAADPE